MLHSWMHMYSTVAQLTANMTQTAGCICSTTYCKCDTAGCICNTACYNVAQHATMWHSMLQCGTACYNVAQHATMWHSMLQLGTTGCISSTACCKCDTVGCISNTAGFKCGTAEKMHIHMMDCYDEYVVHQAIRVSN